jgi:ribonuclease P protein component
LPSRDPVSCFFAAAGGASSLEEAMRETHVPAQQPQAQEEARISFAHAHTCRAGDREGASHAGPFAAHGLIWRIRDHATFRALRHARPARRGPVTVRVVSTVDKAAPPRVAYAVGRSVGGAVERNRLRRRLRAALHDERDALRDGHAYLVGAHAGATALPFTELRALLRSALTSSRDQR